MKKTSLILGLALLICLAAVCGCAPVQAANDDDTLFQVSTLNALMLGSYDGVITADELLENGDTGLGTFDTLEGEMIVLGGTVYQAKADGSVIKPAGDIKVPFAAVTHFESDISVKLDDITDI